MSDAGTPVTPKHRAHGRPIVFMYSGQGSQYYQMGAELYRENIVFRRTMQELDLVAERHLGASVLHEVYGAGRKKSDRFDRTRITHLAIFMVEYALTRVLESGGVTPSLLLGASLGEMSAAAISGMLTVDEAVEILFEHARLLERRCQRGGMLAVLHDPALYSREPSLHEGCEVAAVSGHSHFVIAGDRSALTRAAEYLKRCEILHQELPVEYAFHSSWLDSTEVEFCSALATLPRRAPRLPVISCATTGEVDTVTGDHFWQVFRRPIGFLDTIVELEARGRHIYVDAGPSGTLAALLRPIVAAHGASSVCFTLTPFGQDQKSLARARQMILEGGQNS